nr:MAG TPA: hypothetical protein [Caudoviricetes sp.]
MILNKVYSSIYVKMTYIQLDIIYIESIYNIFY